MTAQPTAQPAAFEYFVPPQRSSWQAARALARENPVGVVALVIIVVLIFVSVFADAIAPYGKTELIDRRLLGPNSNTWLGTDRLGRDVLSRMIYGARISLFVGFIAVGIGTIVGSAIGLISGYVGGWLDLITQRLMDIMMSIPALLLAMVVVAALGRGASNAMFAIAIVLIPGMARLVRSVTLSLKARPFIEAARASGASNAWILVRHIIPNAVDEIMVLASVALGAAIILEAALSFLGLGTQPPNPSWGSMLSEGRIAYQTGPHMVWVPSAAICLTVLTVTMIGDTLRDVLDPKVRGSGRVRF